MKSFSIIKAKHLKFGRKGENIALKFLKIKKYDIFLKNYRVKSGEIDIIARDGSEICFIEVKTRKYSPEKIKNIGILLGREQAKRIKNASKDYLNKIGMPDVIYRYELIEIFLTTFRIHTVYHWQENFGK
ncbi:MAG: YraN family protein [Victivallales bacterium]|nr:YraN family protein [Victivallales bacterium]